MHRAIDWYYDTDSEMWYLGEPYCGCGVYLLEGSYWANVVTSCIADIIGLGPYQTLEEAQCETERIFEMEILRCKNNNEPYGLL